MAVAGIYFGPRGGRPVTSAVAHRRPCAFDAAQHASSFRLVTLVEAGSSSGWAVGSSQPARRIGRFHNRQYSLPQRPEFSSERLPRPAGHKDANDRRIAMTRTRRLFISTSALAFAAAFAIAAAPTADAQQRKSIRWAVASIDTYGYKVAASVTKIIEDALGGEYTVTVNPYPSTTAAMKATMDGDGEIGYTADVGMAELYAGEGGFRNYTPVEAQDGAHLVRLSDGIVHGGVRQERRQVQMLEGLQRQAGVLHAGRLHELDELPPRLQDARLRLQARADRPEDAVRRAAGRHDHRRGRLHHGGPLAGAVLEGNRDPHGRLR